MDALLEEGELMVGIDGDDEGEAGKGHIKSENEVKLLICISYCALHSLCIIGAFSCI